MNFIKKFWNKFKRFPGRYIVMLLLTAAALDVIIETLARHSLIKSAAFVLGHPLVAL